MAASSPPKVRPTPPARRAHAQEAPDIGSPVGWLRRRSALLSHVRRVAGRPALGCRGAGRARTGPARLGPPVVRAGPPPAPHSVRSGHATPRSAATSELCHTRRSARLVAGVCGRARDARPDAGAGRLADERLPWRLAGPPPASHSVRSGHAAPRVAQGCCRTAVPGRAGTGRDTPGVARLGGQAHTAPSRRVPARRPSQAAHHSVVSPPTRCVTDGIRS